MKVKYDSITGFEIVENDEHEWKVCNHSFSHVFTAKGNDPEIIVVIGSYPGCISMKILHLSVVLGNDSVEDFMEECSDMIPAFEQKAAEVFQQWFDNFQP